MLYVNTKLIITNEEKRICNAVYIVQFKNSSLKNVDFTWHEYTMFICSSCYENFFYKRPTSFAHLASEIFILDKSKKKLYTVNSTICLNKKAKNHGQFKCNFYLELSIHISIIQSILKIKIWCNIPQNSHVNFRFWNNSFTKQATFYLRCIFLINFDHLRFERKQ